jgi:prolipoprotein diacylglyceryl transferase
LIPSPGVSALNLGPFTIHFYALCIILGIAVAIFIGRKRYQLLGGNAEEVSDAAIWAVPFGIIGGRTYHVITSPQQYFGQGGNPVDALRIWQGGLGIWGAIAFGAVGSFIYFKKQETTLSFSKFLDALAPGVVLAQAIGRIGNWFNQELFGKPTQLPWGLKIEQSKRPDGYEQFLTFHPTFLYELLWCVAVAVVLIKLPGFFQKVPKKSGDLFVLYILTYSIGRLWIEALRIDDANIILGLRLNIWVSLLAIFGSLAYLIRSKQSNDEANRNISS